MNPLSRLILGTAQLGMTYGIANTMGKPSQAVADDIVRIAWERGIRTFDTAQGYGESEAVLGHALAACRAASTARVITKLHPQLPEKAEGIVAGLAASRRVLGVPRLFCVMLHREEQLSLLDGYVGAALASCREKGELEHIGVSVYSPETALAALRHPLVDMIQVPSSLFDRRFEQASVFALADDMGKQIHIRSVFLQGVLLMDAADLPPNLTPLASALNAFHATCAEYDIPPAYAALAWTLHHFPDASLLFGAETAGQVQENTAFFQQHGANVPLPFLAALDDILPPQQTTLLNPSFWE